MDASALLSNLPTLYWRAQVDGSYREWLSMRTRRDENDVNAMFSTAVLECLELMDRTRTHGDGGSWLQRCSVSFGKWTTSSTPAAGFGELCGLR